MKESEDFLEVMVCKGPNCSVTGSEELSDWCRSLKEAGLSISCGTSRCTGNCEESPVVTWNGCYLTHCSPAKLTQRLIDEDYF